MPPPNPMYLFMGRHISPLIIHIKERFISLDALNFIPNQPDINIKQLTQGTKITAAIIDI
jgi:hypothetical protein